MAFASITKSFRKLLRGFVRNDSGNMTMIMGLASIPVIAAAGMAIDYARISRVHDEIQLIADGATLAAAGARNLTGTREEKKAQRVAIATNYLTEGLAKVTDIDEIGTPSVVATSSKVTVEVEASVKASLINVLDARKKESAGFDQGNGGNEDGSSGGRTYDMTVTSEASWNAGIQYLCMLVLNASAAESLHVKGTADLSAENCAIWVNSTSNSGLYQNGDATITAEPICVTGNYSGSNYFPAVPKTGVDDCPPINDPLSAKFLEDYNELWSSATVQYNGIQNNGKYQQKAFDAAGVHTLWPGRYRGGIKVQNSREITLEPGVYYIENGNFTIMSGGVVNALGGVTIVLTDLTAKTTKNNNSGTRIDVQAGGTLNLKAIAEGRFEGLAIAQHPNSLPPTNKSAANSIIGGGTVEIEGIVYYPQQILYITGNGWISQTADLFAIVADKVFVEGNGQLNIGQAADFDAAGLPALPSSGTGESFVTLR